MKVQNGSSTQQGGAGYRLYLTYFSNLELVAWEISLSELNNQLLRLLNGNFRNHHIQCPFDIVGLKYIYSTQYHSNHLVSVNDQFN